MRGSLESYYSDKRRIIPIIILLFFIAMPLAILITKISLINYFLLILLIVSAVLAMANPFWASCYSCIAIMIIGARGFYFSYPFFFMATEAIVYTTSLILIATKIKVSNQRLSIKYLLLCVLILLLAFIPSLLRGSTESGSFLLAVSEASLYIRPILAAFIPLMCVTSKEEYSKLVMLLVVCSGIVSLFGIETFIFGRTALVPDPMYGTSGRIASTFGNPNSLSGLLELMIPISIMVALSVKKKSTRNAIIIIVVVDIIAILLASSRGGLFSLFLGLGILTIFSKMRISRKISIVFIIILLLALVLGTQLATRQKGLFSQESLYEELAYGVRGEQYKSYYDIASKNLLFGIGWGLEYEPSSGSLLNIGGLNSLYLDLFTKSGLIGIAGLIISLILVYRRLFAVRKERDDVSFIYTTGLIAGLSGFLAHQVFDNLLKWPMGGVSTWFMVGIGFISITVSCKNEER